MMSQNKRGTGEALTARQDETIDLLKRILRKERQQLDKLEEIRQILAKEKPPK